MRRVALLALLLVSVLAPFVGVAGASVDGIPAQAGNNSTNASAGTLSADLAVEAPTGDVSSERVNGTSRYTAASAPLELHPQNFDGADVVDYGVTTPGGALAYQSRFGQFEFSANATGTYDVYWVVSEQVATDNGTVQAQRRYTAQVRVTDSASSVTLSQSQLDSIEATAAKWQEFNETYVQPDLGYDSFYAPEPDGPQELAEAYSSAYRTQHNFVAALSGNFTQIVTILVLTTGGLLFLALAIAYHFLSLSSLKGRLNKRLRSEAHEGDIQRKRAEQSKQQDLMTMENTELQDIDGISDRDAQAIRDAVGGVSVRDVYEAFESGGVLSPEALVADRLRAMGAAGYYGEVVQSNGETTDVSVRESGGSTGEDGSADRATSRAELASDDTTEVNLASMDDGLTELFLSEMDEWDCAAFREFDMSDVDVDLTDATSIDSLDLATVRDDLGVEAHRFGDEASFGEALADLCDHIRMHPSTGSDGGVAETRQALELLLKVHNSLADEFDLPTAEWRRQAIQAALQHHDAGARVERTVSDINAGREVTGD